MKKNGGRSISPVNRQEYLQRLIAPTTHETRPNAGLCYSDTPAQACYRTSLGAGLRIPDDRSAVTFYEEVEESKGVRLAPCPR